LVFNSLKNENKKLAAGKRKILQYNQPLHRQGHLDCIDVTKINVSCSGVALLLEKHCQIAHIQ